MTRAPDPQAPPTGAPRKTLATVTGSVLAAALLFVLVPKEESGRTVSATANPDQSVTVKHVAGARHLQTYLDIVGVPTACDGVTKGVKVGQVFTPAQCDAMNEAELIAHAEPIMRCAPPLRGRGPQAAAVVSLAYNMGTNAICGSTLVRKINAGDWRGAADAFGAWNKVTVPLAQVAAYRRRGETCAPKVSGGWSCTSKGLTARRQRERTLFLQDLPQ